MRKGYKIGNKDNDIKLKATVGTPGIAHTKVFQFLGGGQVKSITESNVDSGNIQEVSIGKGSDLFGSFIRIRTVIDFGSIDSSQWDQLYETIVGKYGISGGFAGNQSYTYDDDDKSNNNTGQFVIIDMEIDLKK